MRHRNNSDNNSQYFWINLRAFDVETKSKWLNMFNNHGNASTLKYRKELTPNIKFQPDRIFVRNDLFEKIIKSCKATNIEFTILKEKLGICPYEENYYEKEIIKTQDDIEETDEEPIEVIGKVSNEKSTKKMTKELIEESDEYSDEELDEMFKELTKIKGPNKDESTTDWYDKNTFKKILTAIDSNSFNHKNKIGKLRFNDINNLVNNIKNNTISEADAKKKINELNEIKKAEIKNKRLINGQKILLNLFDDLVEAIFNNNKIVNEGNNKIVNKDNNKIVHEDNNKIVNEDNNVNDNDNDNDDIMMMIMMIMMMMTLQ